MPNFINKPPPPLADVSVPGLVGTSGQQFAGLKTFTQVIDVGGVAISSTGAPSNATDATNKQYTDTNFAPSVMLFGATTLNGAPVTECVYPGFGFPADGVNEIGYVMPLAGKIAGIYVRSSTAPAGDNVTFTVKVDGNIAYGTNLLDGDVTSYNTTSTYDVNEGSEVVITVTPGAGIVTTPTNIRIGMRFTRA